MVEVLPPFEGQWAPQPDVVVGQEVVVELAAGGRQLDVDQIPVRVTQSDEERTTLYARES